MLKPEQLARMLLPGGQPPAFKLGTIPAGYAGGRPTIQFDGETAPSARAYPKAKGLALAPGDRVLVAMVGSGGVVICVIE